MATSGRPSARLVACRCPSRALSARQQGALAHLRRSGAGQGHGHADRGGPRLHQDRPRPLPDRATQRLHRRRPHDGNHQAVRRVGLAARRRQRPDELADRGLPLRLGGAARDAHVQHGGRRAGARLHDHRRRRRPRRRPRVLARGRACADRCRGDRHGRLVQRGNGHDTTGPVDRDPTVRWLVGGVVGHVDQQDTVDHRCRGGGRRPRDPRDRVGLRRRRRRREEEATGEFAWDSPSTAPSVAAAAAAPVVADVAAALPEPEPEPESEPEPAPVVAEPEPEPEPVAEAEPEPEPEGAAAEAGYTPTRRSPDDALAAVEAERKDYRPARPPRRLVLRLVPVLGTNAQPLLRDPVEALFVFGGIRAHPAGGCFADEPEERARRSGSMSPWAAASFTAQPGSASWWQSRKRQCSAHSSISGNVRPSPCRPRPGRCLAVRACR